MKLENQAKKRASNNGKKRNCTNLASTESTTSGENSLPNEMNEASSKKQKALKHINAFLQLIQTTEI